MKCEHCGAPVRDEGAFCSHCGSRLRRIVEAAPRSPTAAERFDLVAAHDGYATACAHRPDVPTAGVVVMPAVMIAFGVGFTVFTMGQMQGALGPPPAFQAAWLLFCVVFVGLGVAALLRGLRFRAAPIVHAVAVVVDERTRVSGGKSPSTTYHATLQDRDGQRTEYVCESELAGRIARSDIGVAFTKDDRLVDFIRFEV